MSDVTSRQLSLKRYRISEKNAAAQKRYSQSSNGRASANRRKAKFQAAHPERVAARRAVRKVVRSGRLPRAQLWPCFMCIGDADHFHHPSYAPEDRLKIVPLCRRCHVSTHHPDRTPDLERAVAAVYGWVRRKVTGFIRIPDTFARDGYLGQTHLALECGHVKVQRGSAAIPSAVRCTQCAQVTEAE